jgi:hypothetical protein
LSGQFKYAYETNYQDATAAQQIFTQEYLTNLSGVISDAKIGAYQLKLQYQKGTTELKHLNFSNTLNFRDSLKVTTSYLRKDFGLLLGDYYPIADNRFSVAATYYLPDLPSLFLNYETGNSKAASTEGVDKYDRKAELGFNYVLGGNNLSARYVKSVFYDNTYLYSARNNSNRNNLFTLNGTGNLGENIQWQSNYSEQEIFNQTGYASLSNQKLQNLILSGSLRLSPRLSLNPEFTSLFNTVDDFSTGRKNQQRSRRLGVAASLKPVEQVELVLDTGGGQIEVLDPRGESKQNLLSSKVGMNLNLAKNFFVNLDLKNEFYAGDSTQGKTVSFNGYLTYQLKNGLRLSYKRNSTDFDGKVAASVLAAGVSGGARKQEANDWGLWVPLPRNFHFEGGASSSLINANDYRGLNAALGYRPSSLAAFEMKRENKLGNETAQTVITQIDSLKAGFSLGPATIDQQVSWLNTKTTGSSVNLDLYGFRSYTEVKYGLGDSLLNLSVNSERRDQYASVFTKAYASFTRFF